MVKVVIMEFAKTGTKRLDSYDAESLKSHQPHSKAVILQCTVTMQVRDVSFKISSTFQLNETVLVVMHVQEKPFRNNCKIHSKSCKIDTCFIQGSWQASCINPSRKRFQQILQTMHKYMFVFLWVVSPRGVGQMLVCHLCSPSQSAP